MKTLLSLFTALVCFSTAARAELKVIGEGAFTAVVRTENIIDMTPVNRDGSKDWLSGDERLWSNYLIEPTGLASVLAPTGRWYSPGWVPAGLTGNGMDGRVREYVDQENQKRWSARIIRHPEATLIKLRIDTNSQNIAVATGGSGVAAGDAKATAAVQIYELLVLCPMDTIVAQLGIQKTQAGEQAPKP